MAPLMFGLGVTLQLAFLRPLRSDEREELSLLVTWAIALGIEGLLSRWYQTTYRSTNTGYANRSWSVARLLGVRGAGVGVRRLDRPSSAACTCCWRNRLRSAVRRRCRTPLGALLGIDPERVAALGFGLSVATATAAGAVYGMVFSFNPGSHYDLISRLLTIIVLGGLGSLGGAVVAALFMGVAEAVLSVEISPSWASLTFFLLLIAILLVRPQGLLGVRERGAL